MPQYSTLGDNRIKHLEMIQAVVSRLAGNSFVIKGWALTLTGAFLGFAVDRNDAGLAAAAFIPIVFFWLLDTYYLRAERLFRALYDRVRAGSDSDDDDPFFMGATGDSFASSVDSEISSWVQTFWRPTLAGYYGLLAAATVLILVIICTS